jgi:hypothetical protein
LIFQNELTHVLLFAILHKPSTGFFKLEYTYDLIPVSVSASHGASQEPEWETQKKGK